MLGETRIIYTLVTHTHLVAKQGNKQMWAMWAETTTMMMMMLVARMHAQTISQKHRKLNPPG